MAKPLVNIREKQSDLKKEQMNSPEFKKVLSIFEDKMSVYGKVFLKVEWVDYLSGIPGWHLGWSSLDQPEYMYHWGNLYFFEDYLDINSDYLGNSNDCQTEYWVDGELETLDDGHILNKDIDEKLPGVVDSILESARKEICQLEGIEYQISKGEEISDEEVYRAIKGLEDLIIEEGVDDWFRRFFYPIQGIIEEGLDYPDYRIEMDKKHKRNYFHDLGAVCKLYSLFLREHPHADVCMNDWMRLRLPKILNKDK